MNSTTTGSSSQKLSAKNLETKIKLNKKLGLTKADHLNFLKNILTSRKVDDAEIQMKKQNKAFFQISGAGHEGILTALGKVLKGGYDYFIPYYRDRALCLSLGMTPYEMLCQANGNIGDVASHGRQMPSHFGHAGLNIIPKSSCTGTQFNQACGLAEAGIYLNSLKGADKSKLPHHQDEIIFVSCGDGTVAQGEFWEGLNTACVRKLPILFLVEDNGFAISVPCTTQVPGGSISKALSTYPGLKVWECDGNCPLESYQVALEVEKYLRSGSGPVLVHAHVTRPYSHSLSDDHGFYRTKEELKNESLRDVVHSYPQFLKDAKIFSEEEILQVTSEISQLVTLARDEAIKTPWPEQNTFMDHLYSSEVNPTDLKLFEKEAKFTGPTDVPMAQSINSTLKNLVKQNPLVRIFGEDVADFGELEKLEDPNLKGKGGVFKITSGIQRVGRNDQVFNSPLAEANIIGRAIGMSYRGLKPVVEIQFFDYIWPAYMQLKNEMATTRYRSGGDFKSPMVVRVPIGGYLKGGSIYHSQCGESLFTHIPGILVVFPSNALDAAGLLRTAALCDDPVLFLEHKHLYYQGYNRTADPGPDFSIPFGKANKVREGKDATVVCWGAMVQKSVEASKQIQEKMGYDIDVIDLRTLVPLDMETILNSLKKTNRLLIAHEEVKTSGFAGEICMRINEEGFEFLDAPVVRVTAHDTHVAYCPSLEEVILPQVDDVYKGLVKLLSF
jgi:2-oxoisovalerate dehydrogenase E1 component